MYVCNSTSLSSVCKVQRVRQYWGVDLVDVGGKNDHYELLSLGGKRLLLFSILEDFDCQSRAVLKNGLTLR